VDSANARALGDTEYIAAFESGYALSHEQAVCEALAWLRKGPALEADGMEHGTEAHKKTDKHRIGSGKRR